MQKVVFRVPTPALLAAGLALICVTPVAWAAPGLQALYLLPLGFALWVVRNRTAVDGERIVARSTFGRREVPWTDVKAIKIDPKGWLSAVLADDSLVRLPAVRAGHLPALSAVSGGRVADPTAAPATSGDDPDAGPEGAAPDRETAPDQEATPPPVKSEE
ncbi:PH domain-containing protein [Actinosynnema sp. NPDC059797]